MSTSPATITLGTVADDVTPIAHIEPDGWNLGTVLYLDHELQGFDGDKWATRIATGHSAGIESLAVAVEFSGRKSFSVGGGTWKRRVSITVLGDGEPDTKMAGWIYLPAPDSTLAEMGL